MLKAKKGNVSLSLTNLLEAFFEKEKGNKLCEQLVRVDTLVCHAIVSVVAINMQFCISQSCGKFVCAWTYA